MQFIFSSDVRYFCILATDNTNNASLHSSVHSFNFPLILQISLPSFSSILLQSCFPNFPTPNILLSVKAEQARAMHVPVSPVINVCAWTLQLTLEKPPGKLQEISSVHREKCGLQCSPCVELPQWAGGVQNWFQPFLSFLARRFHLKWAAWWKTLKRSKQCNVVRGSTSRAECHHCSAVSEKPLLHYTVVLHHLLGRLGQTAHCTGQSKAVCLVHSFKMHE